LRSFNKNRKKSANCANLAKLAIFAKAINIATHKYSQLNFALNYVKRAY